MYTYIFDDSITRESVQKCIDSINCYEDVCLAFSTNGGWPSAAKLLAEYLNVKPGKLKVVFNHNLWSSGLYFLKYLKRDVIVDPEFSCGLIHVVDSETHKLREQATIKYLDESVRRSNKSFLTWAKKVFEMTEEEIKVYKSGEDVVIGYSRFKKCLKNR